MKKKPELELKKYFIVLDSNTELFTRLNIRADLPQSKIFKTGFLIVPMYADKKVIKLNAGGFRQTIPCIKLEPPAKIKSHKLLFTGLVVVPQKRYLKI